MRSYLKKIGILALTAAVNADLTKRDPYWIKMSDVIQQVRPDFYFGVATQKTFFANPKYKDIMSTFNLEVGGNECKFYTINGSETFNTKACDESIAFAKKQGAKYRGHNLFWPANSPSWFKSAYDGKDPEEVKEYILDYITKVLDHYKDEEDIIYWDVINESVTDDSTPENIKLRTGSDTSNEFKGWDTYTEDIFKLAREHTNENVKLIYNDYNAEANGGNFGGKTGAVFQYIKSMKENGVPIDGVGLQMHISCNWTPNYEELTKLISQYEEIGVEVHVTEIDVKMENCKTHDDQRKVYMNIFKACFDHENCKVFTVWGAYDSESWVGAENEPLIFDEDMYPKDIYFDMLDYVIDKLPADATYPIPTNTERPSKPTSDAPAAAEANYLIKPETFMIDPAWSNWSWNYESVEVDDDGNVVAVLEEDKYGAFSLHTDKEFNAGKIHIELKSDKEGAPVKIIVHTTGDEQVTVETIEDAYSDELKAYDVDVPAAEGDTYNRISVQDAWGKALTITMNNFYFTSSSSSSDKPSGSGSGSGSSTAKASYIVKPEGFMIEPGWANWSWGYESVDIDEEGNVVALFEEEKYGAFSVHGDKEFSAGKIHIELKSDKEGAPVKIIVHTKDDEQITLETIEDAYSDELKAYDVDVTATEGATYDRISVQDAWGKAITLTINNFYLTPAEASTTPAESTPSDSEGKRYDIIKEGEFMIDGKWQNWSWGVEDSEFDEDGNFVNYITADTYGGVSFKRSDSVQFGAGTLYFKAKVNDTNANLQVLFHTTAEEYVNMGNFKDISDTEMTQYKAKVTAPTAEKYDRITIQDVANNGLTLYLNDVYFIASPETEEEPKEDPKEDPKEEPVDENCWAAKLGFNCCKTTKTVVYEDADGNWGVEDDYWCGIIEDKEDQCWSTKLGYPCCEDANVIYTVDENGSWGYEDDHWCGIVKASEKCEFSTIGYSCCPDNEVIFEDDHKWGVNSNGQWCGVSF
ncbi:glycoside hydrolase superfamily [Neocallimastix lanati (nom. inval.)]|jgi:GH35 family endo-1,4-beta-xylanase/RNA binding exosome subunit|nr:glycoside hydrolase superfamily [Neocallimastix sp. JGI-2020a]